MKIPRLQDILALVVFCLVAVVPFHPEREDLEPEHVFELRMASSATGELRLYFDDGNGLRETLTASAQVVQSPDLLPYRLRLPTCELRAIRVDPINAPATLEIADARILGAGGSTVRAFAPADFQPVYDIARTAVDGDRLHVETTPGAVDPQLLLTFDPPLNTAPTIPLTVRVSGWRALALFALGLVVLVGARAFPAAGDAVRRACARASAHPGRTVAAIAFIAAVLSCHPIVFNGRSLVSPNFSDGTVLLYERFPTLPGYTDSKLADANGADVGAVTWSHHPLSIIERRAIFRDGELPLWNRYNSAGATILAQGQSMFGDPLHFLPILANGAAWSWDAKYIIARWLFACGLGLIVLRLTRHAPAAWITAFSSAFVGFFLFRVNHPAYFSFCYAPWILYAWLRITDAPGTRGALPWVGALILASFAELTSGTAKEAYMLLISLNFTGVVVLFARSGPWRETVGKLLLAAAGGVLFVMLSAPIWVTFMDALARSYTSYNNPAAFQIHPSLLPGLFDELFYRPIHAEQRTLNPSANFLVLAGVLYVIATFRRVEHDRRFFALAIGAAVPFALAFGVVPPQWIARVPYLGNVVHVDNTFSCVLIVHLIVLAGYGYRTAASRLGTAEGRGDIVVVGTLLLVLFVPYIAYMHTVHREPWGPGTVYKVLKWGERIPLTPFVLVSLIALPAAVIGGLAVVRRVLRSGTWTHAAVLTAATCMIVLLWRHGQQPSNAFKPYVYAPAVRVDFHAVSPAIAYAQAQTDEPFRIVGIGGTLFPGWSAVYDLEGISGADAVINPFYRQLTDTSGIRRIWDWRLHVEPETLAQLKRVYDALGVRYYLDPRTDDPRVTAQLRRVMRGDLDVYRSDTTWPRAFFTDRVATYADATSFARMMHAGDGRPFAAIQNTDTHPAPALAADLTDRAVKPASDYVLTNNTTSFTVEATGPGVIVLHEAWLKGDFRVTVNGQPARYFRVNHAFKGIAVDQAGTYRVSFAYWPRRFTETLVAAGIAMAVLAGIAIYESLRARKRRVVG